MKQPWQDESDPEKALEKIFETIADRWVITQDDHRRERKIVFTLNPEFNPQKVYPESYEVAGIVK